MTPQPTVCHYCNGHGYRTTMATQEECGFCDGGKPLDTQEDWDRTWGRTFDTIESFAALKQRANNGESMTDLAKELGISRERVRQIVMDEDSR